MQADFFQNLGALGIEMPLEQEQEEMNLNNRAVLVDELWEESAQEKMKKKLCNHFKTPITVFIRC